MPNSHTPADQAFSAKAKEIRKLLMDAVETDTVKISEEHFKAVLLPIFTEISEDRHPSLDPWFTLAGNQHKEIEVYASTGGQYGQLFDANSDPLFIVPPIMEQFEPSMENNERAMAVMANSNPDLLPPGINGSVAHDLVTARDNTLHMMQGIYQEDRAKARAIMFGVAMYDRYGLKWFTDPETGERFGKPETATTGISHATTDQIEFDTEELDEL